MSGDEKFYCDWCHNEITGKIFYRGNKLYGRCCIDNVTPMHTPSTGKYAGGGVKTSTRASMRYHLGRPERIVEERLYYRRRLIEHLISVSEPKYHEEIREMSYEGLRLLARKCILEGRRR